MQIRKLVAAYLATYNACMALGWSAASALSLYTLISTSITEVYPAANVLVRALQLLSIAEVAHSALGLVRSPLSSNVLQWSGRAHALFLVIHAHYAHPQLSTSPWPGVAILAWSFGEACRYPWCALSSVGVDVYPLTWLRYTAFIPMYPLGLVSELVCMWIVVRVEDASPRFSYTMPNPLNFDFHYGMFLRCLLVVQPFAWMHLYATLLKSRAKKLARGPKQLKSE